MSDDTHNLKIESLTCVKPGNTCKIRCIQGNSHIQKRLAEMGVLPGEKVRVVRIAPLGDPMEIRVKGYCLALRLSEASDVLVEKEIV